MTDFTEDIPITIQIYKIYAMSFESKRHWNFEFQTWETKSSNVKHPTQFIWLWL